MFVVWSFVEFGSVRNRNAPHWDAVKEHNNQARAAPENAPCSRSYPLFAEQVELANQ